MAEIWSREELQRWLEGRPKERRDDEARAIAARAALRVFPLVFTDLGVREGRLGLESRKDLILQTFRAIFIAWGACKLAHDVIVDRGMMDAAAGAAAAAAGAAAAHSVAPARGAARAASAAATMIVPLSTPAYSAAAAATHVASAAAIRMDAAPADFRSGIASAAATFWEAISADCEWIDVPGLGGRLIDEPLWLVDVRGHAKFVVNMPPWMRKPLAEFAESELAREGPWSLIVDWYRSVLSHRSGGAPKSLFGEEADIAIATQPDAFWTVTEERSADRIMDEVADIVGRAEPEPAERPDRTVAGFIMAFLEARDGPATIDEIRKAFADADYSVIDKTMRAQLSRLAAIGRIRRVSTGIYEGSLDRPSIPSQSPASVRPKWIRDKLHQVDSPLSALTGDELGLANLQAIREEMRELARSIEREQNIDRRPSLYISTTAELISNELPSSAELFRMMRREAVMIEYGEVVDEQWPDFLARRYRAVVRDFTEALDQFEDRRRFSRSKLEIDIEELPAGEITEEAEAIVGAMRSDDGRKLIDESVPAVIETIVNEPDQNPPANGSSIAIVTSLDQLESINNTFKRLAERADDDPAIKELMRQMDEAYVSEFQDGLVEGAREAGRVDGKLIGKGLMRGKVGASAAMIGGKKLTERFPRFFGWLKPYLNRS